MLNDVIQGASGDTAVAMLLRQVKILSARTEAGALAAWVSHELDGYSGETELPEYRGPFWVLPLGHFVGGFGSEARNVQIPPSTFPEEGRDGPLFRASFSEPIAELEEWTRREYTTFSWSPDAVRLYNHMTSTGEVARVVQPDMVLVEVHYTVPSSTFLGVLDAVRNKVLDLALELERVAPLAGQPDAPLNQLAPAAAVIENHFHGASNVAIGSPGVSQVVLNVPSAGDVDALIRYLGGAGVAPAQLQELVDAVAADEAEDDSNGQPGETRWRRTRSWFARAATDTGTGALGAALAAAAASFMGS